MVEATQEVNLSYVLSDLNARVRVLESKYSLFGERLLVINQNMIDEYKKLMRDIKQIESEISEMKKEVFYLKEVLNDFNKEFDMFARKDNVKVLEKYINLWNPLNFVTEKEVIEIIKREVGKKS